MKPKRIILIRHGESEGNVDKRIYSSKQDYKLDLTTNGQAQALNCGKKLKGILHEQEAYFYVSPLYRTRQTFEEIKKSLAPEQFKYQEEPRLREQEWGHYKDEAECKSIDDARDAFGTFYYRIPDGESAADVYDRVSDFFGTLFRDFKKPEFPENLVLVTHGMTIRLFVMKWFHYLVEDFEKLKNPANCSMTILNQQPDGKYKLEVEMEQK